MEREIARIVDEAAISARETPIMDDVDALLDTDGNSTEDMKSMLEQI